MARWQQIEAAEPEFAARVRARFDAGKHKTIAALRADGSPRISGIEVTFLDGDLWFVDARARKALGLLRDPRFHATQREPRGELGGRRQGRGARR